MGAFCKSPNKITTATSKMMMDNSFVACYNIRSCLSCLSIHGCGGGNFQVGFMGKGRGMAEGLCGVGIWVVEVGVVIWGG